MPLRQKNRVKPMKMHISNVELQNVVEIVRGSGSFLELNYSLNINYELDRRYFRIQT